jgi:hypothetical protein
MGNENTTSNEELRAALDDAVKTLESVSEWLSRCDVENEPYFDMAMDEITSWRRARAKRLQVVEVEA